MECSQLASCCREKEGKGREERLTRKCRERYREGRGKIKFIFLCLFNEHRKYKVREKERRGMSIMLLIIIPNDRVIPDQTSGKHTHTLI